MGKGVTPTRRPRLQVDVSENVSAAVKQTADRFFKGAVSDVVVAAFATFSWMLDQKRQGLRVIAVTPDALPAQFIEPVLLGLDTALSNGRWTWLIERPHPWMCQLWIKGRRMRAAQLVDDMTTNGWSVEEAARQYDLPVAAALEALQYTEENRELIDAESIEEQLIAKAMTTAHPPELTREVANAVVSR